MRSADGLKTGHTAEGGYGMVASAKTGGRRLIGVINGFDGKGHEALAAEMKKLLEHGFATTMNKTFFKAGDTITQIPVWYGRQKNLNATVAKNFVITTDKEVGTTGVRVLARYNEPINAPVMAGDVVGELVAEQNGRVIARANLVAKDTVKKKQLLGRAIENLMVIFGLK
jgi:D-alanyl-D-alanine carboxypeptidase (penicillin-binding protein 5/6)